MNTFSLPFECRFHLACFVFSASAQFLHRKIFELSFEFPLVRLRHGLLKRKINIVFFRSLFKHQAVKSIIVYEALFAKMLNLIFIDTKFPQKYSANIQNSCFVMLRPKYSFGRSEYEVNTSAEAVKKLQPKRSFVRTLHRKCNQDC